MAYVNLIKPAYYNEFDGHAADWLENLIRMGEIAPGDVDRRSIADVRPDDLRRYGQVHCFAGIGIWSHSFRRAGISDDTPVWSGSCPCQPFSAAGKAQGVDDERHLWPHFFHLIRERCPAAVFGEQVASKDGLNWLDLVCSDMEGEGYAFGAVDTCSAGHGAPHIRQRLRFVAYDPRLSLLGHTIGARLEGQRGHGDGSHEPGWLDAQSPGSVAATGSLSWLADADHAEWRPDTTGGHDSIRQDAGWTQGASDAEGRGAACGLADADGGNASAERQQRGGEQRQQPEDRGTLSWLADAKGDRSGSAAERPGSDKFVAVARWAGEPGLLAAGQPGPTNGFWRDADWLRCRDEKWRPVSASTQPLVDGDSFRLGSGSPYEGKSRQGMLKGYGNAEATTCFIECACLAGAGLDRLTSSQDSRYGETVFMAQVLDL